MIVLVIFGGLVAGGALFAALRNSSKGSKSKYTKLNIG